MDLMSPSFKNAMNEINSKGFSAVDLRGQVPNLLGESLYSAMNKRDLHPNKDNYYNEIAFYFTKDWEDVSGGLSNFHDEATLGIIFDSKEASRLIDHQLGQGFSSAILKWCRTVSELITNYHFGLDDNEIRLSRCMIRQMDHDHKTAHLGAKLHEDQGYSGRNYRQLVSAVLHDIRNSNNF